MNQLHIPGEYVDAVRGAMRPCGKCEVVPDRWCPDCPPSFWWGVKAVEPHSRSCGVYPHPHGPRCGPDCPTCNNGPRLPDEVQAMLAPCQTCDDGIIYSLSEGEMIEDPVNETDCPNCHHGRPLVELVTDCQEASGSIGHHVCNVCDGTRTVTLGTVTAREVLPVVHWSDHDIESPAALTVGHSNGNAYAVTQMYGGHRATLLGPPNATHAIRLEIR